MNMRTALGAAAIAITLAASTASAEATLTPQQVRGALKSYGMSTETFALGGGCTELAIHDGGRVLSAWVIVATSQACTSTMRSSSPSHATLVIDNVWASWTKKPSTIDKLTAQAETLAAILKFIPSASDPAAPPAGAKPDAKLSGSCSYLLGDFTQSSRGTRFVSSATIHNTGNIGVIVRFETTWRQVSGPAVRRHKDVKLARGQSKFVALSVIVSSDQIDQIQSVPTNSQCGWKGTMVSTFGSAA